MSEEAVQRLMGLADDYSRRVLIGARTADVAVADARIDAARSTLESALREALGASLMVNGLTEAETSLTASVVGLIAEQPEQPLGDAFGPGSTSLRSSDPYRDVPAAERDE